MNSDSISGIADTIVDEALIQAHQTADAENNQKRVSIVDDTPTDATDGITDSFYDADEIIKSKNLESEAAQQTNGKFFSLSGLVFISFEHYFN